MFDCGQVATTPSVSTMTRPADCWVHNLQLLSLQLQYVQISWKTAVLYTILFAVCLVA